MTFFPAPNPKPPVSSVIVRLAASIEETESANVLVSKNYVAKGYWDKDEAALRGEKHLYSTARIVVVAVEGPHVVGTASIIKDSEAGLPADGFHPDTMRTLRAGCDRLAEISAFAVKRSFRQSRDIVLPMIRFIYKYSLQRLGVDRFVVVVNPRHISFYESLCHFKSVGPSKTYDYVKAPGQLLTVCLLDVHRYAHEHRSGASSSSRFYQSLVKGESTGRQFQNDVIPLMSGPTVA